ncbi:cell division protein ZapA [uncultured Mailhella sp.]|uniref:cell division protein ZapA n=1 Tax=uncultured Mailhella sp. TaxID=1981031 RepID=UPI0026246340|nr:cell division protein ZapA [uncultured Mailhella sp.]
MHSYHLDLFDLKVSFRTEAGSERVERARAYVEKLYGQMKAQGGPLGKECLLAICLIGIADDFLQLKEQTGQTEHTIDKLLRSLKDLEQAPAGSAPRD